MSAYSLADTNLFAYCGNNPVMRSDPNGEIWLTATLSVMLVGGLIGTVVSAAASIASQYAFTGGVNWKSVIVSAGTGFISGAVAASPLGLAWQVTVGGAIGAVSYAADCYVNDKAMRLDEGILATISGCASGFIGGPGANNRYVLSDTIEYLGNTVAREARRQNQTYALKAVTSAYSYARGIVAPTAWWSSVRFSAGTGFSTTLTGLYGRNPWWKNAPSWKPW